MNFAAKYNGNNDVAIKMFYDRHSMIEEITVYQDLDAINNPNIEAYKIPRVYYHGKFLGEFYAIAISLFDGNLADYYDKRKKPLLDMDILYIFLQAVRI